MLKWSFKLQIFCVTIAIAFIFLIFKYSTNALFLAMNTACDVQI